jgi:hypothetical protein
MTCPGRGTSLVVSRKDAAPGGRLPSSSPARQAEGIVTAGQGRPK